MSIIKWEEIRLRKLIAEMGDGGTPSTYDDSNFGQGIPWVVVDDIRDEITSTKQQLTDKGFSKCSAKRWEPGSVILSTGATIGEVGIARVPLCTKQGITGIVCNEHADPIFLKYWFQQNKRLLLRFSQGTTFKEIRTRALGNLRIKIPLPYTKEGLAEQKRIAKLLLLLDEAIDNTKHCIAKANRLKISLMQNLLTGRMHFDGSCRNKSDFYVDNKLGKIPKGWTVGRFKEFSVLQRGKDLTDESVINGIYPVVKSNGVTVYHNSYFVDPPGVVTGRSGTIGNVFFIEEKFWAHNTALYIKDFKGNDRLFIYYLVSEMKFDRYLAGTGVPTLNRNDIHRLWVMIPKDVQEQKAIAFRIKSVEDIIKSNELNVDKLNHLKKTLRHNLLLGKVCITRE